MIESRTQTTERGASAIVRGGGARDKDPHWYKDAIVYEVHVRAFLDSNGDGIGDFRGLTQKLDYLQDLGVTAVWLLPFYPSPLKDDGYDIADYYSINPIYGTLKDFRSFLARAHERDIRVITELVVNHTSDQHPWFQRSRHARPGSPWREFYVWSDTPQKYREARIIFRDFEPSNWTWDPVAGAYYWHRFYAHQPDLNFDNPHVHREIKRVLDFWMDMGVDGVRLDAVPYLYEREGTSCENLPETHAYLKELRKHVDEKYGDRMLLAEANQWPEEAVTYFGNGSGDECHMAFHFPLMPRMFMAVRMEDRVPIVDILEQTPAIPPTSQWALFLRNHDELTLEMVTDEERDYMYRVYANDAKARINLGIRRRLAPLLGNDRKRIELLKLLLFSLPGTPVLYYGDEIGMGDNVFLGDRNGVRTPMQWSPDRNAGFSRASPQALYFPIILDPEYHYEAINVETQQRNPSSLFWWTKRVLALRKRFKAFGRGSFEFLRPDNHRILAFVRRFQKEVILVVANLSRFPQPVSLDLSEFRDLQPVELFGRTNFPAISAHPYFLTLSPHAAYWFSLEPVIEHTAFTTARPVPELDAPENWDDLSQERWRSDLETVLCDYIRTHQWFSRREAALKSIQIRDSVPVPMDSTTALLLFLRADYLEGEPEEYLLPLTQATGEIGSRLENGSPQEVIAHLRCPGRTTPLVLHSAARSKEFCQVLLESILRRRSFPGEEGEVKMTAAHGLRNGTSERLATLQPSFRTVEHSNYPVIFDEVLFLKLFRRLEGGTNPELEVGRFLTQKGFPNVPAVLGSVDYRRQDEQNRTVGILTRFLPHAQDAWAYTIDMLSRYFDRARTAPVDTKLEPLAQGSILELAGRDAPEPVVAWIGTYLELARLLGQRTAELHLCLSSDPESRDFAPEPFTPFYQRALFQSMRNLAVQGLGRLRSEMPQLPPAAVPSATRVLGFEETILKRLRKVCEITVEAQRVRCHGDFHLGQVLFTGKDFYFIDFEGDTTRPMGERRIKRSCLRDIASMIRSFDYITQVALFKQVELGVVQTNDLPRLEPWMDLWYRWVSATFLKSYLCGVANSGLLPQVQSQLAVLLEAHLFEKALAEIEYELTHRLDWIRIPLHGLLQLLEPGRQS